MKMMNIAWSLRLVEQARKLFVITTVSASFAWLPWQVPTWGYPRVYCNDYGCSDYDLCNDYGCSRPERRPQGYCGRGNSRAVLVEFVARGNDWGNVWIDGQEVFQPRNYNRRQTFSLCPGAYRVIFAGNTKFDVWAAGYLDLGRTNIVRIGFSADGRVDVQGDPYAWLPDETINPNEVWRR